jgi:phospholipid/cholesterol/gamma-HCH transport system substrate-binding protein
VRRAIREHLRDFLALLFVMLVAIGVGSYVLSNQRFSPPAWVPVIGKDFYTLNARMQTAQAVVPGQGQTVNIAGVKIGDIGKVTLKNGRAVVELKIQPKYRGRIHRDATILLRPKTGLKDEYLSLDPGSRGTMKDGSTIPVRNSLPDVNPDQILASLDTDTQAYLQILIDGGAQAIGSPRKSADLRQTFKRFAPTARDTRTITLELAKRRRNVAHVIHNFQELTNALGGRDSQLAGFIDSSNANFRAIANQDGNLRQALTQLPGTLDQTRRTLGKVNTFAKELGPTLSGLRPAARGLGPSLRATRPFLRETTPIIKNQVRPFTRDVRGPVRTLRSAARDLGVATPRLARTFKVINSFLNLLAYNPRGSEEGYLFWASWVNHNGASLFGLQDANGPLRRSVALTNCNSLDILEQIRATTPNLAAQIELLNLPKREGLCPSNPLLSSTSAAARKGASR